MSRHALVLGGSGAVGREVVRALRQREVGVTFTWHTNEEAARVLESEYGAVGRCVDLRDLVAVRRLADDTGTDVPDIVVHCAAISRARPLQEATEADWEDVLAVNVRSAWALVQQLAPRWSAGADVVLVGALDRNQSFDLPAVFAASQGALSALTMALAHELGSHNVRVNQVALGVLDGGLSRDLAPELLEDFRTFSALRRTGTAREVAAGIAWLACENTFMSGRVLPLNGGL